MDVRYTLVNDLVRNTRVELCLLSYFMLSTNKKIFDLSKQSHLFSLLDALATRQKDNDTLEFTHTVTLPRCTFWRVRVCGRSLLSCRQYLTLTV